MVDEDTPSSPLSGEVNLLPLRQVLDGRVKRRIRRNGLSEEMNCIYAEKKRRADETKAALEALKAEVAAKNEEIKQLQQQQSHDVAMQDAARISDLEKQIGELRERLARSTGVQRAATNEDSSYDWTMAAKDPFSMEYTMMDASSGSPTGDIFGDTTMADLQCSTPSRTARNQTSFPTPPSTSPFALPMTPSSRFSTPRSHAGVQVAFSDTEKQQLEEEVASLQLEICKLTNTVESYQGLANRLSEKLASAPASSQPQGQMEKDVSEPLGSELERQLAQLLQVLSDRTAAVLHLSSSLSELGFPGSDASDIIGSLSAAFRTARLELEYLTPGEIPLPLTSAGAQVLDLLLDRLRDFARKGKEADEQIDEYHELELDLRKQLTGRVDAMDGLVKEVSRLEAEAKSKNEQIKELEVGTQRLKGAVASYARDVGELERLVERIEADLEGKTEEVQNLLSGQGKLDDSLKARDATISEKNAAIAELESRLTAAMKHSDELRTQLAASQQRGEKTARRQKEAVTALNRSHGQALALRDARVSELRGEIDRVNAALRAAHDTVRHLRVDKAGLATRLDDEKAKAKAALDAMKAELERVAQMSQDFLVTPRRPATRRTRRSGSAGSDGEAMPATVVRPGKFLAADLARRSSEDGGKSGKKRRRYDSGLGFLDEDEIDAEA
jgi:chromosome segregation ATPase